MSAFGRGVLRAPVRTGRPPLLGGQRPPLQGTSRRAPGPLQLPSFDKRLTSRHYKTYEQSYEVFNEFYR